MKTGLQEFELDIAKEIINIAFSKAADSLSFFTKEKVLIQIMEIKFNTSESFSNL